MITGGDLRQSRLDVGYKTFTISPWVQLVPQWEYQMMCYYVWQEWHNGWPVHLKMNGEIQSGLNHTEMTQQTKQPYWMELHMPNYMGIHLKIWILMPILYQKLLQH